jgi:hypothetical protein
MLKTTSHGKTTFPDPAVTEERRLRAGDECQARYGHASALIEYRQGDAHFYARAQMEQVPYRDDGDHWIHARFGEEPPKLVWESTIAARCLCCYKQDPVSRELVSLPLHITCPGLFPPST